MRSVGRALQRGLRWFVVDQPCRFYLAGEVNGGLPAWVFFLAWAVVVALGGVCGSVRAAVTSAPAVDGFLDGAFVGLLVVLGWLGLVLVVLLVLWCRGRSPAEVLNGTAGRTATADRNPVARRSSRHARAAADVRWRRPGDPVITWSWVAALVAVGVVALGWSAYLTSHAGRIAAGLRTVDAVVDRWNGEVTDGRQVLEVHLTVDGTQYTGLVAVPRGTDGSWPATGDPVSVEYPVGAPDDITLPGREASAQAWARRVRLGGLGALAAALCCVVALARTRSGRRAVRSR